MRRDSRPDMNSGHTPHRLSTAHAAPAENVHTQTLLDRGQLRDLAGRLDSGSKARIDVPLSVSTPSINWWPYPPWGQSTVSLTPSVTATPSTTPPSVAVLSASPLTSTTTTSSLEATSSLSSSPAPSSTVSSATATPSVTSLPSRPEVNATAHSNFNPLYLIPVFIAVGLLLGALCGLLGYRWYMRRLAHQVSDGSGNWRGSFISGPPYVPMRDMSHSAGGTSDEASSNDIGSPSKYTRHSARHATKAWLSSVTRTGSRRASTRNTVPPSRESTIGAAASSHSRPTTTSPPRARSRGSTISPTSSSDGENSHRAYTRASIRRKLLERMQCLSDRSPRGVIRDPSRRTTQTYLSAASAYSGTHAGDSLSPSAVPSSAPNTEWEPGSGFRIIVEDNTTPPRPTIAAATDSSSASTSVSGLPRRTSVWDNGEALRQAVSTHPGERWLAWTRSWVSNPPPAGDSEDRFTAVPSRRGNTHTKDAEVLLRSPPQVTSSPLQSTLTFSPHPQPGGRPPHATTVNGKNNKRRLVQAPARTRVTQAVPLPQPQANAVRGTSSASSIVPEDGGHGTPAMRYAARHTALSRVEEILAHSYSSRDLAPPDSPNAFGAAAPSPSSLEDIAWAAGIEQRLALAAAVDRGRGGP